MGDFVLWSTTDWPRKSVVEINKCEVSELRCKVLHSPTNIRTDWRAGVDIRGMRGTRVYRQKAVERDACDDRSTTCTSAMRVITSGKDIASVNKTELPRASVARPRAASCGKW